MSCQTRSSMRTVSPAAVPLCASTLPGAAATASSSNAPTIAIFSLALRFIAPSPTTVPRSCHCTFPTLRPRRLFPAAALPRITGRLTALRAAGNHAARSPMLIALLDLFRIRSRVERALVRYTGYSLLSRHVTRRIGVSYVPTLLLVSIGQRSGELREAPLFYFEDGDDYFVVGSIGGSPRHPEWYPQPARGSARLGLRAPPPHRGDGLADRGRGARAAVADRRARLPALRRDDRGGAPARDPARAAQSASRRLSDFLG